MKSLLKLYSVFSRGQKGGCVRHLWGFMKGQQVNNEQED